MQPACDWSNRWERVSPFPAWLHPSPRRKGCQCAGRAGGWEEECLRLSVWLDWGIAFQVDGYKLSAWNCRSRPRFLCWLIDSPRRAI